MKIGLGRFYLLESCEGDDEMQDKIHSYMSHLDERHNKLTRRMMKQKRERVMGYDPHNEDLFVSISDMGQTFKYDDKPDDDLGQTCEDKHGTSRGQTCGDFKSLSSMELTSGDFKYDDNLNNDSDSLSSMELTPGDFKYDDKLNYDSDSLVIGYDPHNEDLFVSISDMGQTFKYDDKPDDDLGQTCEDKHGTSMGQTCGDFKSLSSMELTSGDFKYDDKLNNDSDSLSSMELTLVGYYNNWVKLKVRVPTILGLWGTPI